MTARTNPRRFDSRAETAYHPRLDTTPDDVTREASAVSARGTPPPVPTRRPRAPTIRAHEPDLPPREARRATGTPAPVPATGMPRVMVVDAARETATWIAGAITGLAELSWVSTAADAVLSLRRDPVRVLIVGDDIPDMPRERLITAVSTHTRAMVIAVAPAGGPPPAGVFYQIDRGLAADAVRQVVGRALASRDKPAVAAVEISDPLRIQRLAAAARCIALQRSAPDLARAIAAEVPELVGANRATCLFFDGESAQLWSAQDPDRPGIESPMVGIAGFAARTGAIAIVDRAGEDPRYRKDVDDPVGRGDERLAAVPIIDPGGEVHAVVVVARDGRAPVFDPSDRDLLVAFAARVAPVLDAFALEAKAESLIPPDPSPFRPEAVAAYKARKDEGAALRLAPRWAAIVYWVLIALVAIGVSYLCLARINDYAEGPAVMLVEGQQAVTVRAPGTVSEVVVAIGQRVVAHQELVRLYDASEAASVAALEQQFEQALVERLQRPQDTTTAGTLAALLAQRDRARHDLAERTIRAPSGGVVGSVRLRPGQPVTAGQEALTLVSGEPGASMIAFLPASYGPLMKPGLTIRLELDGHPRIYQHTKVESFTTHASGPTAISQYLGDQLGDAIRVPGAVVLVRARMEKDSFIADEKQLAYRHGMTGKVNVRIRSQRMILSVIPGLKEVFGYDYD
jgi:hypothetical protein